MKPFSESLPEGYILIKTIDMQKNKTLALALNLAAILLLIPFVVIYILFFAGRISSGGELFAMIYTFPVYIALIILHEMVHALYFRLFSGSGKMKFGFNGLFAYAGNPNGYYRRREYIIIGLAPAVILSLVMICLMFFTPGDMFPVLYLNMACHFAGCIGDFYTVEEILRKTGADAYIIDTGMKMEIYDREKA